VEASEVRRPNHERDTANVQALQQYITPLLQQYAMTTGDTKQLNDFFDMIGESMEMPAITRLKLGPWSPPTDEQSQQLMQAAQQAEVENVQSDSAQKQAAAKKLEAEAVATMAEMGSEGEGEGQNAAADKANEVAVDEVKFRQSLSHKQQEHEQKMISNQELLVQKLLFSEAEATIKQKTMQEQGAIKNAQAKRKSAIQPKSKA
jgi:hypothetical protein